MLFRSIILGVFFCALGVRSADMSPEFKLINEFLDEHPLASSDGQHEMLVKQQIKAYTSSPQEQKILMANHFVFSAIQAVRKTKLVAVITPVIFHERSLIDLRETNIWPQLLDAANNAGVEVINYSGKITLKDDRAVLLPTFLFINCSYVKWQKVADYFIQEKRNANYHPSSDINFVIEGYLLGYTQDNIKNYYNQSDSNRKLAFDQVEAIALQLLEKKFEISNVSDLLSGQKKFAQ